jgi:hypothetical protein
MGDLRETPAMPFGAFLGTFPMMVNSLARISSGAGDDAGASTIDAGRFSVSA